MRFVCDSCRAQYMISDEKVGAKGVKVRCKKCGYVILVKKTQEAAPPPPAPAPAPAPTDEGADATQVMQNPLGQGNGAAGADPDATAPGLPTGPSVLAGVADDEIGAVFDQVLNSGAHKIPVDGGGGAGGEALGDGADDRLRTRVLDAEVVRKLAEEAAAEGGSPANGTHVNGKNGAEPSAVDYDWFVAIDDQQVGPLKLDAVKDRWDKGEIGPDSLCWRAGFSDWVALSEVSELASVLAPQPRKPVIVSSSVEPSVGAMVTVPVESTFSSGGVARTVRNEIPVLTAAPSAQEDVGWKPSAASALASLVKEEIEALTHPPPAASKSPERDEAKEKEKPGAIRGLLDVPSEQNLIPDEALVGRMTPEPAPKPATPRGVPLSPSGAFPASTYRPPVKTGGNRTLMIIGGAVVGLLVLMIGAFAYLFIRQDQKLKEIAQKEVELKPVALAQNAQPAQAQAQAETRAPAPAQPEEKKSEGDAQKADAAPPSAKAEDPEKAKKDEPEKREVSRDREREKSRVASGSGSRREEPRREEPKREEVARASTSGSSGSSSSSSGEIDDFEAVFGGGSKRTVKRDEPEKKGGSRDSVYIPPAPGSSADLPERLGQSDIMQVVLSNKPAIVRCVQEQKKKDPNLSGKLVMRWTIKTNGRTSNVSAQTEEFKSTYMATCIAGLIKSWKFPAHKVQGDPIDFPFTF